MSAISRDSCTNHVYFGRRSLVDHDYHVVGLLAMIDAVMDVRRVETELTCSAGGTRFKKGFVSLIIVRQRYLKRRPRMMIIRSLRYRFSDGIYRIFGTYAPIAESFFAPLARPRLFWLSSVLRTLTKLGVTSRHSSSMMNSRACSRVRSL